MMFGSIEQRARRWADERRRRLVGEIAAAIGGSVHGVTVRAEGERVVLSGRGLVGRWLREPGLRFLARIGR